MTDKIECTFRQIKNSKLEETRSGRYSQSMHWEIPEFGVSKWVILGYLDIDWQKLKNEDYLSETDILDRCLLHLNETPPRKKFQKKEPRPKFGKLEKYKAHFKVKNKPFIIVELLTDQHDNENFWAEGPLLSGVKIKKTKKEEEKEPDQLDA